MPITELVQVTKIRVRIILVRGLFHIPATTSWSVFISRLSRILIQGLDGILNVHDLMDWVALALVLLSRVLYCFILLARGSLRRGPLRRLITLLFRQPLDAHWLAHILPWHAIASLVIHSSGPGVSPALFVIGIPEISLDTSLHLYMRVCLSIPWSVHPFVTRLSLNTQKRAFSTLRLIGARGW